MSAQLSIRVDEETQRALAAEAARQRRTVANLTRVIFAEWLESRSERREQPRERAA
jgi:predicted HicB family RNase H-like nuclease